MNFTPLDKIPDVSFYQDDNTTPQKIDFAKMKSQVDGVIIRAGQNTWIDEDFIYNWQAAKDAGLKRGSYWFYDPRSEPISQAKRFTDLFKNDPPELGLWNDFEFTWDGSYKSENNCKTFNNYVVNSGIVVGVYSANWWWTFTDDNYWSTFPLWVAQYIDNPYYVVLPSSWRNKNKDAVLWQYTSKGDGKLYGTESLNIDLNYTSQAFYDLFNNQPPTGDSDMTSGSIKGVAKSGTVTNVKPMAGGVAIHQLSGGQYVYGEYSSLQTDIINFDHYYQSNGTIVNLGTLCKCSVGNLIITQENENPVTPPPSGNDEIIIEVDGTATITLNGNQIYP